MPLLYSVTCMQASTSPFWTSVTYEEVVPLWGGFVLPSRCAFVMFNSVSLQSAVICVFGSLALRQTMSLAEETRVRFPLILCRRFRIIRVALLKYAWWLITFFYNLPPCRSPLPHSMCFGSRTRVWSAEHLIAFCLSRTCQAFKNSSAPHSHGWQMTLCICWHQPPTCCI